jgi:hypothetical protein
MQFASISAEYCPGHDGFICSVFEVPQEEEEVYDEHYQNHGQQQKQQQQQPLAPGIPSRAFLEREDNFELVQVPFFELHNDVNGDDHDDKHQKQKFEHVKTTSPATCMGLLCVRSTDEAYIQQWGEDRFERYYGQYGLHTIWNWQPDSGLLPCAVYLRHCVLAAQSMGPTCYQSLLDETYLVDRTTTVREYLQQHAEVMTTLPPPEFASKYSG